ncbi:uncharacterized protein LOC132706443 [Cylas formicarius]|uniref:uncharacterized protein LOC132706443 n=1 Tax=Cylas formicarius TaxID=197179 RepID=UPI00295854D0|nr:uncharacterized protein LOC132706443 [Cylas formicarius]
MVPIKYSTFFVPWILRFWKIIGWSVGTTFPAVSVVNMFRLIITPEFSASGIWKLEMPHRSRGFQLVYLIYSIVANMIYISIPLLLTINFPRLLKTDAGEGLETLPKILFCFSFVIKLILYQSESTKRLLAQAITDEAHFLDNGDYSVVEVHEKHVFFCNLLNKFFLMSTAGSGFILCEMGIVGSYKVNQLNKKLNVTLPRPLPLPFCYPFDENNYHIWILLEQLLVIVWCGFSIATVQIFSNSMMIYMRGQLKILQKYFSRYHRSATSVDGSVKALKLLCVKHQHLISFIDNVNGVFRNVVFIQYSISSIMLAMALFQVLAGNNVTYNITYVLVIISELLLLAWSTDEIVTQSDELASALYSCTWYECDRESRILIILMLIRCQKPLSIDIGSYK